MDHPNSPTPSPWAILRSTRRAIIAITVLLSLWILLVLSFMWIGAWGVATHGRWSTADLCFFLALAGFVVSHSIVGWKMIQLIRALGRPGMESDPKDAATAFTAFWKTNLRAHAILWVWIVLLIAFTTLS